MSQVLGIGEDEQAVSQKLIEAALNGDEALVDEILGNAVVDVNFMGTINLTIKHTNSFQHEEAPDELKVDHVQYKTDVTPLFAAAHAGHVDIVKKILTAGADVNQRLFRGYAITAATREGHPEVLSILLKAGSSQPACEEALLEACLSGQVNMADFLISWEMARVEVQTNALIRASSRGLVGVVELLIKSGVDVNSMHRVLLCSIKPALHTSVDCTALVAAIVCRQSPVVKYLLEAGAKADCQVRLGAWSWDSNSGEVLRVGAGMAEPYSAVWCAVEYWEATGMILRLLLEHVSANSVQMGRSLLCHAVLCGNAAAAQILLEAGADVEHCVSTTDGCQFRPLHLAAKLGFLPVLKTLMNQGCNLNAMTDTGDTALMLCAVSAHLDCFHELLIAGADFARVNKAGYTVIDLLESCSDRSLAYELIWDSILSGRNIFSSDLRVFCVMQFVARHGNAKVMKKILEHKGMDVNLQDKFGLSAAMVAAQEGHMEVFKVLLYAGASMELKNKKGETALMLADKCGKKDECERILLDSILDNAFKERNFNALHFAARKGNCEVLAHLLKQGCAINSWNEEGYTALMISMKEGHLDACKLLLSQGADCYLANPRGDTALSLARKSSSCKGVEEVLLDHMAKKLVLAEGQLTKHTREGKGQPHMKIVKMLKSGILRWGESKRRNVICKEASRGSSLTFRKNRKNRDTDKPGLFRVVTITGREIHFEASVAFVAELWVRGINLIVGEAMGTNSVASR
ncbi:hypothetical protein GOP47_0009197 [Adiantum capillus-veneris]|uniref:Uncharacterized protein n=1 Tax=Adiantum capillus-veneris TaxID=13818 RepID=A0A9D4UWA3_ADICA|nr:hypothetical protein GOP47_0009197 [Adiantum capillus-veneris]